MALVGQGSSTPNDVSPLQKVREMLSELSKEIPIAQQADEHQMEEFMMRSNKTLLEASTSAKEQQALAASLKASIAKAEASRKELEAERERAAAALLEAQTTLSVAKMENEQQSGSRRQRLQSLRKDAKVVSMALHGVRPHDRPETSESLLQSARTFERVVAEDRDPRGAASDVAADRDFTLRKATARLRKALAVGGIGLAPAQRRLIQALPGPPAPSFLQLRGSRETEDPMAPLAETLAQVKRQTTTEIQSTEESQKKTQQAFEEVSRALKEQIEAKKKAVQEVEVQIHELEEVASKDRVELQLAERKAQASATSVAEIAELQKQRGTELQARSLTRTKEAEALAEALRILSQKSSDQQATLSFFQLGQTAHRAWEGSRGTDAGREVLADASQGGQFEAVRRLVQELLRELHEKQAQDTRQDDWCGSELNSTSQRLHDKAVAIEELQARQTGAASEYGSLAAELKRLGVALSAIRDAAAAAQAERKQEKAKALADQTSYEESRRVVKEAVAVLKKVYSGPTAGRGVVGLLEFSAQNYADLVDETRKAEEAAIFEFKRARETREVQVAGYDADVTYKRQRSETLAIQLKAMKKELAESQVQQAALQKYLEKVRAECRVQPEDFAGRAAKREEEIRLLKEAQDILQERDD